MSRTDRAFNLTASIIWNLLRFVDRCVAARASREGPGEGDDEPSAQGCDRVGDASFGSDRRRLWVDNGRERQIPRRARRGLVLRGKGAAFGDQDAVGGDPERRVMVEAAPAAPFVIAKAKLLIIALDPPAQFGDVDQLIKGNILAHGGKPIVRRPGFALRPLDQQPFFRAGLSQRGVAMSHGSSPWAKGPRSHPLPCAARSEPVGAALAPGNGLPCGGRQAESEGLD
jgi:hypothetical protein